LAPVLESRRPPVKRQLHPAAGKREPCKGNEHETQSLALIVSFAIISESDFHETVIGPKGMAKPASISNEARAAARRIRKAGYPAGAADKQVNSL